ncbi:hypothetical protein BCU94_02945 [Shewanella sp. 10N.286.52.C2]|uniref:PKD domain-containing protein n=1 Tax=Shewanella sp. 10N.286.52.C2 TaxID=1880838 RepID=UPI000C83D91A|nr:putative Ig domain-containing protein [Shewanella sp. 10N.286.52.C2]PMG29725.1 hypothetical protein BCU94_02945 [Shewanella sp. 10N.286.52.C2]
MSYKSGTIGVPTILRNALASAIIITGLSACGGGSSGDADTEPQPQNQPPSANAGADQSVDENIEVTLTGSGTDSDGTINSYSWAQTSGTSVSLQNADSSTATFEAPDVTTDEQLVFKLTVTDDDGASATDSVQITILNVANANQPPSANAGEAQEALESTVVALDGSASSDADGTIGSYNWEQISNGAPVLTINNATEANASVELPELANNVEFTFRLTVTDNDGETSQDEVVITGRPTPSVTVSDVSGNTATLNSAAEFSVLLASQPSFNVSIPVSSSDESEGTPEQSELTFTPENWQQAQTVVVRGTNEDVQNDEQDYQIILGSAISSDLFYNGIDPTDVALKGIELSISQPETLNQLIADSEATLQPQVTYTGNNQLSYSLTESPEGMNVNLSTGEITWTPQASEEGQSYTVGVSANDGNKFTTVSFEVTVAALEPVTTEVEGNTLSVVDSSTTLNGMTITTQAAQTSARSTALASTSAADLTALDLAKLSVSSVPEIPDWVTPLTDVFVVRGSFESNLELRFPIANLPANVSLSDVNLYAYTEADDVVGKFWSPVSIDINFEGTIDSPVIVIELDGLEGMAFLGYATPQAQSSNSIAPSSFKPAATQQRSLSATADSVSCEQQSFLGLALDKYVCTSSDDSEIEITIKGFGDQQTRWGGATKEDLVSWLLDAQENFSSSSLGFNKVFKVKIHEMDYLGYVTTDEFENRNTLHITDNNSYSTSTIQGTAVHEYFHHAQGHSDTKLDNRDLLIDGNSSRSWLIEGTARWFEDELYDSLDTFKSKEGSGSRINEAGINADDGDGIRRPYQRFSFFKLVTKSCPNFAGNLQATFNVELSNDPSGITNLTSLFSDWSCNFGAHLGSAKASSLETALSYYNYATQHIGHLSLLDSNESNTFSFDKPNYQFDKPWLASVADWIALPEGSKHKLNGVSIIPSSGAYSFKVPAISGELPEGKIAELVVESNREVIVSVTSEGSDFVGTNTIGTDSHTWFSTVSQTSYIYDANGTVPELFVTLVNPSLGNSANVDVYFKIRDELDVDTIITSHATGDQVSNRVVSISGNIPEEARESTSKVTVTANGIATDTTLNSDGSFVADVIVTLGDNIIKAQGFSGSTPVTNEEIIIIQGVESSSTGRNALIASRAVFVLRWDTHSTDLDIYSTDKNGGTIWYSDKTEGPGNLDYDNTSGFGPEVVSYRSTNDDVYVNGTFDVDVHYYSGSPSTNYTLDIVLNETGGSNRRLLKFDSVVPHTQSSSSQDGPSGSGVSRFNDILTVSCSSQRICSLAGFDASKLAQSGSAQPQSAPVANTASIRVIAKASRSTSVEPDESIGKDESAYTQCMAEFESSIGKTSTIGWTCNKDGTKLWH